MLKISWIKIDSLKDDCIVDSSPNISFALESDQEGESLKQATIICDNWRTETIDQLNNLYKGDLKPFTKYDVHIKAIGTSGESAELSTFFQTGRLNTPWEGKWITDTSYNFPKKESPLPMTFRRNIRIEKKIKKAWINSTALGIYELNLNGKKVGKDYFAPGLTSYLHQIQYQTYDATELLQKDNELIAVVAGGWAAGSFNYNRKSKISADQQAFLCELFIQYDDGTEEIIISDNQWEVTLDGNYRFAEWYDGETYDARINLSECKWKNVDVTYPRGNPKLLSQYGPPVRQQEIMNPIRSFKAKSGEIIYDFGQNFSGVINAKVNGKEGQEIVFRHAEVLVDNELFVKSLRTAKATATYICIDGHQKYSPKLTYMGFRYVGVSGIEEKDIKLSAYVLHSDIEEIGIFECSNQLINQLQSNIRWGGKSNFVDIPTDCPQRDERQGWTGDISVYAKTACFNFDMSRFFDKWLLDMRSEQGKGGGIPMVIPRAGDSWPVMATSCWGDSCILVPWAEYLARGNIQMLREQYPTMKKFLKAAKWWSSFLSFTPNGRYIWRFPFHFGDWCAPDETARQWMAKGKWVATAYFANSCSLVAKIANILGYYDDEIYYRNMNGRIKKAYHNIFTDKKGKLKKEFQTAYVLPLAFDMTDGIETEEMVSNLVRLVKEADNHLTTGFTGTPYLLFALSDHGYLNVAYDLLLQETCPSWLYEVKAGGTTIWERWDALREDGTVNIGNLTGDKSDDSSGGGMVSFNHYANGAVGDWLYRRMAGIEPTKGGYKEFNVEPLLGGEITYVNSSVISPYGKIQSNWKIDEGLFTIDIQVPVSTLCNLRLPNGEVHELKSGEHYFSCEIN